MIAATLVIVCYIKTTSYNGIIPVRGDQKPSVILVTLQVHRMIVLFPTEGPTCCVLTAQAEDLEME